MTRHVTLHNRTLCLSLFPGLVPERASEMAAYGAEAGGQVGQVRRRGGRRQPRRPWALWEQRRKWRAADEPTLHARRPPQPRVLGVSGLRVILEVQVRPSWLASRLRPAIRCLSIPGRRRGRFLARVISLAEAATDCVTIIGESAVKREPFFRCQAVRTKIRTINKESIGKRASWRRLITVESEFLFGDKPMEILNFSSRQLVEKLAYRFEQLIEMTWTDGRVGMLTRSRGSV